MRAELLVAALCLGAFSGCGDAGKGARENEGSAASAEAQRAERIVTAGGAVTETVFALGFGDRVVAVDTSSTHPPDALRGRPSVGYQRSLAAEGILAQRPTLVLLTSDAGPPAALEQLKSAGVRMAIAEGGYDVAGAEKRIHDVAKALGAKLRGEEVARAMRKEHEDALAVVARATSKPRTLFIYARGGGTLMVGGRGTPADAMIRFAGGVNAIESFDGFRPLTAEAVSTAAPDVILLPARGLESLGGREGLLAQPGIDGTAAAKNGRIVAMDDLLLLGFGPRLGRAVRELSDHLHPELTEPRR